MRSKDEYQGAKENIFHF